MKYEIAGSCTTAELEAWAPIGSSAPGLHREHDSAALQFGCGMRHFEATPGGQGY